MQLVKYSPLKDLMLIDKDLQKMFDNSWAWPSLLADQSIVDLYAEDGKLVAEVTVPDFKKEEIKVDFKEGDLEITAEHAEKQEKTGKRRYLLRESSRNFYRRISLPAATDADAATASFKDGKLTITVPLAEEKPTKEVAIT